MSEVPLKNPQRMPHMMFLEIAIDIVSRTNKKLLPLSNSDIDWAQKISRNFTRKSTKIALEVVTQLLLELKHYSS